MTLSATSHEKSSARERIVRSAYQLFSHRAIRDVGVDELIHHSGVANATFYRHFPSKSDVVLAFMQYREQVWTYGLIESEARRRGETPQLRLLAIFDVFDEWFRRDDFEACSFINVLLEMGSDHPLGRASMSHLEHIRDMVRGFAEEAGLRDLDEFVWSWHILMKGSIVSACEGDQDAAVQAKRMAGWLIETHQP
ncbi:MAG: TetR/AcrR family transcriptional regulator [Microbacteriaceae bacterium]